MSLRTLTEHENTDLRHTGMDSGMQGRKDTSGDIHLNCIPALHAGMSAPVRAPHQHGERPCRSMPQTP
jgi:hypothetical protein